jgi:hypothetical protein
MTFRRREGSSSTAVTSTIRTVGMTFSLGALTWRFDANRRTVRRRLGGADEFAAARI